MARFSKEELLFIQKDLTTDKAIGNKYGITRQRVQQLRKLYGIPPLLEARTTYKMPRITKNEFIRLQKDLLFDKAIAGKVGISLSGIRSIRKKYGISPKFQDNAKRNAVIISLADKGITGTAIAVKTGLSTNQVCKIIRDTRNGNRKTAKKLPMPKISKEELIKLQKYLFTDVAIGENFGGSQLAVFRMRKKYGISAIVPDYSARNKRIVHMYKMGTSGYKIGKIFGLSHVQVYKIIRDVEAR